MGAHTLADSLTSNSAHTRPASDRNDLRANADRLEIVKSRRAALAQQLSRHESETLSAVASEDSTEYATAIREERELELNLASTLRSHPAWPWVSSVRGVTPVIAACLLARLDVHRAPTPSSFWSYCGLATVPAVRYLCPECGLDLAMPEGVPAQREHRARATGLQCTGELVIDSGASVRAAPRTPRGTSSAHFDTTARKFCYLIGMGLLRGGSEYKRYYEEQRIAIGASHAGWNRSRVHMSALRKTEKLFLKNLWLAWRTAEGLPIVPAFHNNTD